MATRLTRRVGRQIKEWSREKIVPPPSRSEPPGAQTDMDRVQGTLRFRSRGKAR